MTNVKSRCAAVAIVALALNSVAIDAHAALSVEAAYVYPHFATAQEKRMHRDDPSSTSDEHRPQIHGYYLFVPGQPGQGSRAPDHDPFSSMVLG